MINGCSNYKCAVTGRTEGQFTQSTCGCVGVTGYADLIEIKICGNSVGNPVFFPSAHIIVDWLKDGGLRDILALEREEKGGGA